MSSKDYWVGPTKNSGKLVLLLLLVIIIIICKICFAKLYRLCKTVAAFFLQNGCMIILYAVQKMFFTDVEKCKSPKIRKSSQ